MSNFLSKSTTATQETPTAKLGFVVFIERTTYCRESNRKMGVHKGRGRDRGCHSGPDQLHATLDFGSYLKGTCRCWLAVVRKGEIEGREGKAAA